MSEKTNEELKADVKISLEIIAGFVEDAFESLKQDDVDELDIELDQLENEIKKVRRTVYNIFENEEEL